MKKIAKFICVMLSAVLCATCCMLIACEPSQGKRNETLPLVFSSGEFDKVFNPFFSSSVYDSEIVGQTQISMLNTDDYGNVYCGTDQPMVALNLKRVVTYNGQTYDLGVPAEANAMPDVANPENVSADDYYTTYEFLIKNGIKFSDGVDLTIRDVIFNLYTYLDPTYYGSSTIYSTDITGLNRYRTQVDDSDGKTDGSASDSLNESAQRDASRVISRIEGYYNSDSTIRAQKRGNATSSSENVQDIIDYIEKLRFLRYDEIVQLWASADAQKESYVEQNEKAKTDPKIAATTLGFTETWQIFLYDAGIIKVDWNKDGTVKTCDEEEHSQKKNIEGKPIKRGEKLIDYAQCYNWWKNRDDLIKIVFNGSLGLISHSLYGDDEGGVIEGDGNPHPVCDIIVDSNTDKATGSTLAEKNLSNYRDRLWNDVNMLSNVTKVIYGTGAGSNFIDELVAEQKDAYFEGREMLFPTVEGIKVIQLDKGDVFEGEFDDSTVTDDHQYVLQIRVDRVDPKAIWNFGFTVAPMHFYSNGANDKTGKYNDPNVDYRSFNYPVCDKDGKQLTTVVKTANGDNIWDPNKKDSNGEVIISTGRPFAKKDYMDNVIKAGNIINLPLGAGVYQISSQKNTGEDVKDTNNPYQRPKQLNEFLDDNIAYFIRNPYFYTTSGEGVGPEESSICNAKIKYINYQVINTTKLINSIIVDGTIHFGDPNATQRNIDKLNAARNVVGYNAVDNNGYGYIGINPTYVPDIDVRRAIMSAMNIDLVNAYYGNFAEPIYRSMSTTSWASPQNPSNEAAIENPNTEHPYNQQYYPYKAVPGDQEAEKTQVGLVVDEYLSKAGYTTDSDNDGILDKKFEDGTTHNLKYTFTIAGATDDHPAYSTMKNAADILNEHGFSIVVKTDSTALSKLASGTLTVWAAAWGSAIDPDMYQVYHMDSSATSTRNWGYPTIISKSQNVGVDDSIWDPQMTIIEELSELIDQARNTLVQKKRAEIYLKALDKVMELAVELPLYQRDNLFAYRTDIIDVETINQNPTVHNGVLSRIWEVELVDR